MKNEILFKKYSSLLKRTCPSSLYLHFVKLLYYLFFISLMDVRTSTRTTFNQYRSQSARITCYIINNCISYIINYLASNAISNYISNNTDCPGLTAWRCCEWRPTLSAAHPPSFREQKFTTLKHEFTNL